MRKRRRFSEEEKNEIISQIDALVAQGQFIEEASKQVGIASSQYRNWKRALGLTKSSGKKPRKASPSLLTVPVEESAPPHSDRLVVLIGRTQDVSMALDKLVRIHGA